MTSMKVIDSKPMSPSVDFSSSCRISVGVKFDVRGEESRVFALVCRRLQQQAFQHKVTSAFEKCIWYARMYGELLSRSSESFCKYSNSALLSLDAW